MKTILVPVDFSDTTAPVLAEAQVLAKALGGDLVLLKVAEPEPDFVGFEPGPQTVRVASGMDAVAAGAGSFSKRSAIVQQFIR